MSWFKVEINAGSIYDKKGMLVVSVEGMGYEFDELGDTATTTIDDLVKLKDAGFTAEEIVELKKREVI